MELNRLNIPQLIAPEIIPVIEAEKRMLDNGLSVYVVNAGTEDVIRLELIFPSGTSGKPDFTIAAAAHQLLDSGTATKKAIDIAEEFDYYGAYLQNDFGPDWKTISLFSLTRFFPDTLRNLIEILNEVVYTEQEVATWKTRSIQQLKVNNEKVSWLSKVAFNETLYGSTHPYGYSAVEQDYLDISAASLQSFHKAHYPLEKATLIVSGKVDESILKTLNDTIGKRTLNRDALREPLKSPHQNEVTPAKKTISKKDAVQSGIRIGKTIFNKTHPDFPALQIVNTILGGYFGSRLMSNIREDKGYTYGIGSGLHTHLHSGYFYITTEVGKDVQGAALEEIYKEVRRLREEPVAVEELLLVKNYLIGSFQRSLDGPFSLADRFRGLHLFGLGYDYLESYQKLLHNITPQDVMKIAQAHLDPDTMTEIVAG